MKDYYNIDEGLFSFDYNWNGLCWDKIDEQIAEIVYKVTHDWQKNFKTFKEQELFLKAIEEIKIKQVSNKNELENKFSKLRDNIISWTRKNLQNLDSIVAPLKKWYISVDWANIRDDVTMKTIWKIEEKSEITYLDSPFTNQFKTIDGKIYEYVRVESWNYKWEYIPKEYININKNIVVSRWWESQRNKFNIEVSKNDLNILQIVAQVEAWWEWERWMAAVIYSILNRIKSNKYPDTLSEILSSDQYDSLKKNNSKLIIRDDVKQIVSACISWKYPNPVWDADSFYAPKYWYSAWHEKQEYIITIWWHKFFKTIT